MPTQMSRLLAQGFVGFFSFISSLLAAQRPVQGAKIGARTLITMIPRAARRAGISGRGIAYGHKVTKVTDSSAFRVTLSDGVAVDWGIEMARARSHCRPSK